ncbi:MAG TPA: hypothetical protein VFB50_00510 [Chloroflexota bacterium]|nr:hypothetical protein [Chloroflexota bacterium]
MVILEPGLPVLVFNVLFQFIAQLQGVRNVTDLNKITRPTLETLLNPVPNPWIQPPRRRKSA